MTAARAAAPDGAAAPALDREVGAEVEDRQAGAARGDGEGERTELVSTARAEADEDGSLGIDARRRLEGHRQPPQDGVAGGMLAGNARPRRAPTRRRCARSAGMTTRSATTSKRAEREGLVERRLERRGVELSRRLNDAVPPAAAASLPIESPPPVTGVRASSPAGTTGCSEGRELSLRAVTHSLGRLMGRPPIRDELPHRSQPLDRPVVVEAIARGVRVGATTP